MRRRRTARCVAWPHSATVKAFSPTRFCLFIACQVLPLFGVTSVGLRLHDVSWGRAPSTTISTNNEESTNEDRGDPASQEIPADLQDNGVINTSAAASGCNAGVEGSSGGSLKGEEEEPRAQETISQDGDSSAGEARCTAALGAQGADSGADDHLNFANPPPNITHEETRVTTLCAWRRARPGARLQSSRAPRRSVGRDDRLARGKEGTREARGPRCGRCAERAERAREKIGYWCADVDTGHGKGDVGGGVESLAAKHSQGCGCGESCARIA